MIRLAQKEKKCQVEVVTRQLRYKLSPAWKFLPIRYSYITGWALGPGVRPVNAYRAHVVEGRNECIESLPGASQGDFPGQVKGGMDALDLKGVHHVQN